MTDHLIYLDHAATTPADAGVVEAMLPFFSENAGNPSSVYQPGQDARAALDRARGAVAQVLQCQPAEILFTSGATESDNLALSGVAWNWRLADPVGPAPHIITTTIEHHAVLHTAQWLERVGFAVTYVGCDHEGIVSPDAVLEMIRPETCLISVMYANNETGAIQPVEEIGTVARQRGIPFHVDATQASGFLPLDVNHMYADLMSLSAHKCYGPKGVGMLYVRKQTPIAFQQHGGGQESGRRGGTENVPGIVGFAAALELAEATRSAYIAHCRELRDRLADGIFASIDGIELNGPPIESSRRLPNNLNIAVDGVQGETALLSLDMQGIAASAGSACTTGNSEPSHVLLAMGLTPERARSSLRFTVGRSNELAQMDDVIDVLIESVDRIRSLSLPLSR
jgi:cysteine desulfurase